MDIFEQIGRLSVRDECVKAVDCHTLERFIVKVYGIFEKGYRWFSLVATEEWSNDSSHWFTVERGKLTPWEKKDLDRFMRKPLTSSYVLDILFRDLCNNGYLEPGNYIVSVSW